MRVFVLILCCFLASCGGPEHRLKDGDGKLRSAVPVDSSVLVDSDFLAHRDIWPEWVATSDDFDSTCPEDSEHYVSYSSEGTDSCGADEPQELVCCALTSISRDKPKTHEFYHRCRGRDATPVIGENGKPDNSKCYSNRLECCEYREVTRDTFVKREFINRDVCRLRKGKILPRNNVACTDPIPAIEGVTIKTCCAYQENGDWTLENLKYSECFLKEGLSLAIIDFKCSNDRYKLP